MQATFRWGRGGYAALSLLALLSLVVFTPVPAAAKSSPTPDANKELRCLALNVYWEARGEPFDGQLAVAHVTLNRVKSPRYPSTICSVVHQGGIRRDHCQFSWYCDGKSDKPRNEKAWRLAQAVAWLAILETGTQLPGGDALYFHADYVNPAWAKHMQVVAQIGHQIYYQLADLGNDGN